MRLVPSGAAIRLSFALAVAVLLAGCSGYRTFRPGDFSEWPPRAGESHELVKVGDHLRVKTSDGETIEGALQALGDDAMVVAGTSVPYASVQSLRVRGILWGPTAVAAGLTAYGVLVLTRDRGGFSPDEGAGMAK